MNKKTSKKKVAKKTTKKKAKKLAAKATEIVVHQALTELEERFCRLYALGGNAAKAYKDSGYADQGENNRIRAYQILQKTYIIERVDYYKDLIARKLDIRDERILAEFMAVGFSDIGEAMDITKDGGIRIKTLDEMPEHTRRAISSIKLSRRVVGPPEDNTFDEVIEIKTHPKVQALQRLADIKGLDGGDRRKKLPRVEIDVRVVGAEK